MKKLINSIQIMVCLVVMISMCGCESSDSKIQIYNVDDTTVEYQFVCENDEHYYYYADGKIYAEDGQTLCKVNDNAGDPNVRITMAADGTDCYYCDSKQGTLLQINIQTGEKVELEKEISCISLYGFSDGVFASYDKGDNRYLKYYSRDTVVSVYDEIESNKKGLKEIQTEYEEPLYIYEFNQYKILLQYHAEQPWLKNISDDEGKEYSEIATLTYVDGQDIYEFFTVSDYKYNGAVCNYDSKVSCSYYEKDVAPRMASIEGNDIYILHEFMENPLDETIAQQILTVFNTENKENKVLYQTEEDECIVNYSVEDNRLYILKNGKIYWKSLDDPTKKGERVCKVPKEHNFLGFEYVKGHLFIYDFLYEDLIGIYE
ncbi:MAG: hypothetical protein ACI4GW_06455 [Lachnospiraceae bacterium]